MLVKEYKRGNTTIRIHDDCYKYKTPDEVEERVRRCFAITLAAQLKQQQQNPGGRDRTEQP